MLADPLTKKDALKTCQMNHTLIRSRNSRTSAGHRPMSTMIGQRQTLEMFGVGQHGRHAERTKEPVGCVAAGLSASTSADVALY